MVKSTQLVITEDKLWNNLCTLECVQDIKVHLHKTSCNSWNLGKKKLHLFPDKASGIEQGNNVLLNYVNRDLRDKLQLSFALIILQQHSVTITFKLNQAKLEFTIVLKRYYDFVRINIKNWPLNRNADRIMWKTVTEKLKSIFNFYELPSLCCHGASAVTLVESVCLVSGDAKTAIHGFYGHAICRVFRFLWYPQLCSLCMCGRISMLERS